MDDKSIPAIVLGTALIGLIIFACVLAWDLRPKSKTTTTTVVETKDPMDREIKEGYYPNVVSIWKHPHTTEECRQLIRKAFEDEVISTREYVEICDFFANPNDPNSKKELKLLLNE